MKKLFFTALCVAVAATSCTKQETIDIRQDAMSFEITTNASTKATTLTSTSAFDFYASAWSTGESEFGSVSADADFASFMTGETFSYDGSALTVGNEYYWPSSDATKISFFAATEVSALSTPTTSAYPSFTYTTADGKTASAVDGADDEGAILVSNLTDLLVGTVSNQTSTTTDVAFNLDHALAKVCFSVLGANSSYVYTVEAVRMNDVATTETFTYADYTSNDVDGSWSTGSTTDADYALVGLTSEVAANATTYVSLTDNGTDAGNEFIVMPQSFDGWVLVKYSVATAAGVEVAASAWATAKMVTPVTLAASSQTTFKLELPASGGNVTDPEVPETEDPSLVTTPMTFSVTVNGWDTNVDNDVDGTDWDTES